MAKRINQKTALSLVKPQVIETPVPKKVSDVKRYAIITNYSDDHATGLIKRGEYTLAAIVYAKDEQHAVNRYRVQFKAHDTVVKAVLLNTPEGKRATKLCLYVHNKTNLKKGEPDYTVSELLTYYAELNEQYNVRRKKRIKEQEKKMSKDIKYVSYVEVLDETIGKYVPVTKITATSKDVAKKFGIAAAKKLINSK